MVESGDGFSDHCHKAVVMPVFHGGPWRLLFASRDANSEQR